MICTAHGWSWRPECPHCEAHMAYSRSMAQSAREIIAPPGVLPAEQRKQRPVASGVVDYFPDALLAVAHCSWVGNEQHNPGSPLHWDRDKSQDEADALMRHFIERGTFDSDGVRHSAKVAWRALALLQKEIENNADTPNS